MTSSKRFKQDCDSQGRLGLPQSAHHGHKKDKVFEWKEMYDDGHLVDFTIKTSGGDIRCHRVVLITNLPYFKGMYEMSRHLDNGCFETADLSFLHPESVKQVIEFAYTNEVSCSEDNIEELVKAASYLQADDVIAKCLVNMELWLTIRNSLKYFNIGSTYFLPLITKEAYKLVLKYFVILFQTDEFLKLHVQDLCALLQDDRLNVKSEELVFHCNIAVGSV